MQGTGEVLASTPGLPPLLHALESSVRSGNPAGALAEEVLDQVSPGCTVLCAANPVQGAVLVRSRRRRRVVLCSAPHPQPAMLCMPSEYSGKPASGHELQAQD